MTDSPVPQFVGFAGYPGAGKDTAASILRDLHGWSVIETSHYLKRSLLALNPIVCIQAVAVDGIRQNTPMFFADFFYKVCHGDWALAKKNPEVRRLLQRLGTECGRNIHGEDCWIKKIAEDIDTENAIERKPFAITGIRFQNEIDFIKKRGGIMIYVERESCQPLDHVADQDNTWIKKQSLVLVNDGTLADLGVHLCHILNINN